MWCWIVDVLLEWLSATRLECFLEIIYYNIIISNKPIRTHKERHSWFCDKRPPRRWHQWVLRNCHFPLFTSSFKSSLLVGLKTLLESPKWSGKKEWENWPRRMDGSLLEFQGLVFLLLLEPTNKLSICSITNSGKTTVASKLIETVPSVAINQDVYFRVNQAN